MGGLFWKLGIPNQILVAMMNSSGGMARPKLTIGGALSQALVSLLLAECNVSLIPKPPRRRGREACFHTMSLMGLFRRGMNGGWCQSW